MNAWLLTWNPARIDARAAGLECVRGMRADGDVASDWSVGGRHHIAAGDCLYLMRVGPEPDSSAVRGIVAVGEALSPPHAEAHWSGEAHRRAWYVPLVWLVCQPYGPPLLRQRRLKLTFPDDCFSPQSSGIRLRPEVAHFIDARVGLSGRARP